MRIVSTNSTAGAVRHAATHASPGTFLRRRDFAGTDRAVESALSRLAAEGELIRVRRGLYWRGSQTRFGMTRPSPLEVALAVAGPGAGPSGVAAAHALGLTSQVPGTVEVAVPGKVPQGLPGVRYRSRPYGRRERALRPLEVAVLEVLRDPDVTEMPWPTASARIDRLMDSGEVRREAVLAEAREESHRAARSRAVALVGPA